MTEELIEAVARALADEDRKGTWMDSARAALAAIEQAGWAVVPLDPTDAMTGYADSAMPRFEQDEDGLRIMGVDGAKMCWDAMLSARPRITGDET